MKRTRLIDLVTTIRNSFVSFFAISMFVGLGVGLFLGISWVSDAMHEMASLQFDKGNAHHFEITFPFGLTEEHLERLAALDGVEDVEAGYLAYQELMRNNRKLVVRVGELPKRIDTFIEVEGTLPQEPGEIAIESKLAENYDLAIGDTVGFRYDSEDENDRDRMTFLNRSRFEVTAIVKSPAFLATNTSTYGVAPTGSGSVNALAWICEEDFDPDAYNGGMPYVLVRSSALDDISSFDGEYETRSDALQEDISALSDELADERITLVVDTAQAALDKNQEAYDQAVQTYEDQRAQLEEAERRYKETKEEVEAAQKALDSARDDYDKLTARRKAGEISEREYNLTLDRYGALATVALETYGYKSPYVIDHTNMDSSLDLAQDTLDQKKSRPYVVAGRVVTYNTAPEVIEEAHEALDEAKVKIDEGGKKIEEAQEALAVLKSYTGWIILSRTYNGAMVAMDGYAHITDNLRWSMASLFLIVGLLVCYSAVSRIVHEHITRIGTKKALGFHNREIYALFMGYTALCVLIGLVVGVLLAIYVVEGILISSMGNRFVITTHGYHSLRDIALIGALELALILGATWLAVHGVIGLKAVDLLAGERPHAAKPRFYESWNLWKRMSLLAQTTVNNCINDTRRVVGTLVGVSGCTALIVCAMTLNDNVMRSFTRQYEFINHYDTVIGIDYGSEAATEGPAAFEAAGMRATPVLLKGFSLEQEDGSRASATLIVPTDDEAFKDFVTLIPTTSDSGASEGAWVSQAYHEHLKAQVGDTLVLVDNTGGRHEVPIAGFFEYHLLQHEVILSRALYEETFGVAVKENRLLVDTAGKGSSEAGKVLHGTPGYLTIKDDYNSAKIGFTEFSSIARIVVVVYLVLATVMAACVLLNLDFMFVAEKKRELIVLMINGYSLSDAKGYIWHDSVVLTALGILCGLVLGSVVGNLTIYSIEQSYSSFLHDISWLAVGVGIVGSTVLAAGALAIALRRIEKFDLTDINRF